MIEVDKHDGQYNAKVATTDITLQKKIRRWTFSIKDLTTKTPSHYDNITFDQELIQRAKGVNFIFQAGQLLNVDNVLMVHAAVFLHRFYLRFSIKRFHTYDIAGTSLFLATKIEEQLRRLRDVAIACTKTASKNPKMMVDEQSKDFWRWSEIILYDEEILLEALGFDVIFNFYDGLSELEHRFGPVPSFSSELRRFLVDISRLPLVLVYRWSDIVLSAFKYLLDLGPNAARMLDHYADWEAFLQEDGRIEICDAIVRDMGRFYAPVKKYMPREYEFPAVGLYDGVAVENANRIKDSPAPKESEAASYRNNVNGKRNLSNHMDESPSKRVETDI